MQFVESCCKTFSTERKQTPKTFLASICIIAIRSNTKEAATTSMMDAGAGRKEQFDKLSRCIRREMKENGNKLSLWCFMEKIRPTLLHHQSEVFRALRNNLCPWRETFSSSLRRPCSRGTRRRTNESLMKHLNGKAEEQLCRLFQGYSTTPLSGALTFHNYLFCIINHVAKFPVAKERAKHLNQ